MSDFDVFFETYGQPIEAESAEESLLSPYRGVVPDALIDFWRRYGFGGYANGLLWVVNPSYLEAALREWIPQTRKADRAIPVVRTAFGNIVYWQRTGFTFLDVHYRRRVDAGTSVEVLFGFYLVDQKSRKSVLEEPEFKRALKSLGTLKSDEAYSFKLPLAMGGDAGVKNMQKVKLREMLALLASA